MAPKKRANMETNIATVRQGKAKLVTSTLPHHQSKKAKTNTISDIGTTSNITNLEASQNVEPSIMITRSAKGKDKMESKVQAKSKKQSLIISEGDTLFSPAPKRNSARNAKLDYNLPCAAHTQSEDRTLFSPAPKKSSTVVTPSAKRKLKLESKFPSDDPKKTENVQTSSAKGKAIVLDSESKKAKTIKKHENEETSTMVTRSSARSAKGKGKVLDSESKKAKTIKKHENEETSTMVTRSSARSAKGKGKVLDSESKKAKTIKKRENEETSTMVTRSSARSAKGKGKVLDSESKKAKTIKKRENEETSTMVTRSSARSAKGKGKVLDSESKSQPSKSKKMENVEPSKNVNIRRSTRLAKKR